MKKSETKKKICFACSAGGHLNEIKELYEPLSQDYNITFLTIDREDSRTFLKGKPAFFIRDFKRNYKAILNLWDSLKYFFKIYPDIIITTGAGAAFIFCILGKIFFKKLIYIESFARITRPSLFAKLIYPFSNAFLVQWPELQKYFKKAIYGGPIYNFNFNFDKLEKKKQIFVTVGTSEFPYNRLIRELDEIAAVHKIDKKIIAQTGACDYIPKNFSYMKWCAYNEMIDYYKESEIVICHAGAGTIMDSLLAGAKVIVVPRYKKFGEHYDNHQLELAAEFEKRNLVIVVRDIKQLHSALINTDRFIPQKTEEGTKMISNIKKVLNTF